MADKIFKYDSESGAKVQTDVPAGGNANWGDIGGTLSEQTDLQGALNGKSDTDHNHDGDYAPALGSDDNYVTDTEKSNLHAPGSDNQTLEELGGVTLADVLAAVYPVGCIYTSVDSTNPATVFGFGTWAAFGAGKVLVGLDGEDADFDTVEETGGAKTNTPSAHSGTAVADHDAKNTDQAGVGATQRGSTTSTLTLKAHVHNISAYSHSVTNPNNHAAMSIVQPYIVVYIWKRTA